MTVQTSPVTADQGIDDEPCHIYCCDRDVALCGADISGIDDCNELCWSPSHPPCPLCIIAGEKLCPLCGDA